MWWFYYAVSKLQVKHITKTSKGQGLFLKKLCDVAKYSLPKTKKKYQNLDKNTT